MPGSARRSSAGWPHAGLSSPPFAIEHMTLFESHLGGEGARYEVVERWRLA
jgi:2'-5' RNA ligase